MSRKMFHRIPVAITATLALGLAGCAGAAGGNTGANDTGEGIDPGATKEEYIAAFQDVEPIELDFQISVATPSAYMGMRDIELAESITEWSGGKITVNVHHSGTIAGPLEVPDALIDGRLDLAHHYTTYEPDQMAAFVDLSASMVQVPSTPLVGEIVSHAVIQEAAFNTPEVMNEFADRGLHVLNPANTNGNTTAICTEPRNAPNDWQGSQIRGIAGAHQTQVAALDSVVSSVEFAEGYEALERGILDCSLQASNTALSAGWVEVAPHVLFPREQSFAPGPGSVLAGAVWEELPLLAQQLIFDRMQSYTSAELYNSLQSIKDISEQATENGGEAKFLDTESEAALKEANEELLQQVESSTNLDGKALNDTVAAGIEKWTGIAEELGYTDEGGYDDFPDWYQGSADFNDREYLEKISNRIFEEVILPQRPS